VIGRVIRRLDLGPDERAAMYRLFSDHFDGVTPEMFGRDTDEKNWVILLEREGQLVGFSTLLAYETRFRGEPISVVYSGDTIVAPQAWGTATLPRVWIASVNRLRQQYPRGRYYWLLITSGFRTYRFLPLFWREFYPRFETPTPRFSQELLDHLATERFGPRYDSASGIVRFVHPQKLRPHVSGIPQARLSDPNVAFFAARNPGHAEGDELVCLCEIARDNLTPAGCRMVDWSSRPERTWA
jgi:hypothetical protein